MHYGNLQVTTLAIFGALALLLVTLFLKVASSTSRDVPLEEVQEKGYRLRRAWLASLAALVPIVVGVAALTTPYASGGGSRTLVKVTSGQFFFATSPTAVPAGTKVRFAVTSRDVTHGFGLYNPNGVLIGSVQAMPGYTNHLDLTLTRPGTYRILCFELCGIGHHAMQGTFSVTRS